MRRAGAAAEHQQEGHEDDREGDRRSSAPASAPGAAAIGGLQHAGADDAVGARGEDRRRGARRAPSACAPPRRAPAKPPVVAGARRHREVGRARACAMSTQARSAGSCSSELLEVGGQARRARPDRPAGVAAPGRRSARRRSTAGSPTTEPTAGSRVEPALRARRAPPSARGSSTPPAGVVTQTSTDVRPSTVSPNARVSSHDRQVAVDVVEGVGLRAASAPARPGMPDQRRERRRAASATRERQQRPAPAVRPARAARLGDAHHPAAGDRRARAGWARAASTCSAG